MKLIAKNILIFSLMFFASSCFAMHYNNNQSNTLTEFLHKLVTPFVNFRFKLLLFPVEQPLAKDEYQQLGKEAQTKLGIQVDKQVPIKVIPNSFTSIFSNYTRAIATAGTQAIYINQDSFNEYSYGEKRVNLFHEAIHIKNHDSTMLERIIFETIALSSIGYFIGKHIASKINNSTLKLIQDNQALAWMASGLLVCGYLNYRCFINPETKADADGAYASDCYQCVTEFSNSRIYEHPCSNRSSYPYLSCQEVLAISETLQSDNKLCTFHAKSLSKN